MMRRIAGAFALATMLAGCGQAFGAPNTASTAGPAAGPTLVADPAALLARPLKLKAVQSGSACPITPVSSRKLDVTDPRGSGPFFLGGEMPRGAFPWNKMVWVLVDGAQGPVLLRGARVDGSGSLQFSGNPASASEKGAILSSNGGVSATFYQRVIDQGAGDAFYVYPETQGCYALQVDGPSFEDVIVIRAS
jgi:hypothetical protein